MAGIPEQQQVMLLQRARALGRLPVIVGLAVPPEGGEPGPDEEAAIARAQARLLQDLGVAAGPDGSLAGPGITNVKPFATIPYLALTAEPGALAKVLRHPLVASAQEDATLAPM
jgi:hypothetical protein